MTQRQPHGRYLDPPLKIKSWCPCTEKKGGEFVFTSVQVLRLRTENVQMAENSGSNKRIAQASAGNSWLQDWSTVTVLCLNSSPGRSQKALLFTVWSAVKRRAKPQSRALLDPQEELTGLRQSTTINPPQSAVRGVQAQDIGLSYWLCHRSFCISVGTDKPLAKQEEHFPASRMNQED